MSRVTAVVLTLNEARNIVPCLRTLRWTDALLIVDTGSTDRTRELAAGAGARVLTRQWKGWADGRNFALDHVETPWVLFVDADERVPIELAAEIKEALARADATEGDDAPAGYWIPRQNLIVGRWIRHTGWSPDYQLRLFRVDRGRYDVARPVHELVQLAGAEGHLRHRLVHHNYVSWRQFWAKQRRYARDEARQMFVRGDRAKPHNFVLQPLRELRRRYIALEGYRDGVIGAQLSVLMALANLVMYVELRRLSRTGGA